MTTFVKVLMLDVGEMGQAMEFLRKDVTHWISGEIPAQLFVFGCFRNKRCACRLFIFLSNGHDAPRSRAANRAVIEKTDLCVGVAEGLDEASRIASRR